MEYPPSRIYPTFTSLKCRDDMPPYLLPSTNSACLRVTYYLRTSYAHAGYFRVAFSSYSKLIEVAYNMSYERAHTKKSDFSKRSELCIKTCCPNVALMFLLALTGFVRSLCRSA
ncbi:hypothetical protein GJAV_G00141120 [Gymnothorax javanicus]|nr:hypothetical protein GJAV_G00141120 [Gymnothorax javanicus]